MATRYFLIALGVFILIKDPQLVSQAIAGIVKILSAPSNG